MTTTTAAQQRFSTFAYNLIIIIFIIGLLALIWFTYGRQVLSTEPPIPSQVTVIEPAPLPVAVNAADVLFQESFDVDTSSSWDMSIAGQAEIARGVMVLDDNQYDGLHLFHQTNRTRILSCRCFAKLERPKHVLLDDS